MAEPKVEISTDKKSWSNSVEIIKNDEVTIYYKIVLNDVWGVSFFIPVEGEGDVTAKNALVSAIGWQEERMGFTIIEPDPFPDYFQTKKDKTALNFSVDEIESGDEVVLSFSFRAPDNILNFNLGYEYKDGNVVYAGADQLIIKVVNQALPPIIKSFTTTSAALSLADHYTLAWDVENAEKVFIKVDVDEEELAIPGRKRNPKNGTKEVMLIARSGYDAEGKNAKYTETANIKILGDRANNISKVGDVFIEETLLNLIKKETANEQIMYALALNKACDDVLMWKTEDGTNWTNTGIGFKDDNIPISAAGSSGIFFNDRIYLIGGSRFDPNDQRNTVYSYNFLSANPKWSIESIPTFSPRMGQAIVFVKKSAGTENTGEIFLLGGYGQEGTLNDMHSFNGENWKMEAKSMRTPLCMHTAYFDEGQLQVYGGCTDGPNSANQLMGDAVGGYVLEGNVEWRKLGFEKSGIPTTLTHYIVACALAKTKTDTYFLGVYEAGGSMETIISEIIPTHIVKPVASDIPLFGREYAGSLQAIDFKKAIWVSYTSNNDSLYSAGLNCFIYHPSV